VRAGRRLPSKITSAGTTTAIVAPTPTALTPISVYAAPPAKCEGRGGEAGQETEKADEPASLGERGGLVQVATDDVAYGVP
jgi:hypothetical protein